MWFTTGFPKWLEYRHLGWFEFQVSSLKSELKLKYGISLDALEDKNKAPEEIIAGQIKMEDYLFSLNPILNISCAGLIEVHP